MFALVFVAAALAAGAFFVVVAFLGAAFFAGAFLGAAAVFAAALAGAFVVLALVAAGALVAGAAAGAAAAGVLLGPASFTVPDGPVGDDKVSWVSGKADRYAQSEQWRRRGWYAVLDGANIGASRRVASCCDRWEERTLRARKHAAVRSSLQCQVEVAREGSVGDTTEGVVGLNVFLEGLTTVERVQMSAKGRRKLVGLHAG